MSVIRTEISDGIATVTLDRPPVNAIDVAASLGLTDVYLAAGTYTGGVLADQDVDLPTGE